MKDKAHYEMLPNTALGPFFANLLILVYIKYVKALN